MLVFFGTFSYLYFFTGEGSAHQDHWSQGKDSWCVEEEVEAASSAVIWKRINSVYFALSCVSLMQLYITNTCIKAKAGCCLPDWRMSATYSVLEAGHSKYTCRVSVA